MVGMTIGALCNGIVAVVLATFGSVEMFFPIDGATGLYLGIPAEVVTGAHPSALFARHLIAVVGALHCGMAVCLLLSTRGNAAIQSNAATGVTCYFVMHIAAAFRVTAYESFRVDPVTMPTGALLVCGTILMLGVAVEGEVSDASRTSAIRIAEQKEFKGNMMENKEYVRQLAAAREEREAKANGGKAVGKKAE